MTEFDHVRLDQAIVWAAKIQDPDFADWGGHSEWLSEDPRNVAVYHDAVLLIEEGLTALPSSLTKNVVSGPGGFRRLRMNVPRRGTWLTGGGLALAASLVALLVAKPDHGGGPKGQRTFATLPGEMRTVALADGSTVALNGGTMIRVDAAYPRRISLERGEAFVVVLHDPARPFELRAGDAHFRDVGTAFDIVRSGKTVQLSVHEGAVMFDPDGRRVRLNAGRTIKIANGLAVTGSKAPGAIGSWREGRLVYKDELLSIVAEELARAVGAPVRIAPALHDQRFTGVIPINDRRAAPRRLGLLIGEPVRNSGGAWQIGN